MITLIKNFALNTINIYVLRFVVLSLFVWVFFGVNLAAKVEAANITISGTLYTDAGVTTAGSGKTIKVAVGTSTASIHSTTTASNGTWQITNISDTSLASTTPFTFWLDGDANDATTLVMGYSGSNITGIPLYYNYTIANGTSSSATLDVGKFSFYDRDNDDDILYKISSASSTIDSNLLIKQGIFSAPAMALSISGNYQNDDTFINNYGSIFLTGTSKTISGKLSGANTLYNLRVTGSYTMATTSASTTNLTISSTGSFTASSSLTAIGNFTNQGTFSANNGTIYLENARDEVMEYLAGRDTAGSAAGTGSVAVADMVKSGNYLYLIKFGDATACSQTAGSAIGCELMVFDISSSTNPTYVAGRDASGSSGGTSGADMRVINIKDNYLYIGKGASVSVCSQTAGSATGCELMVFDISSSTNPTYVAGRDSDGSTGTKNVAVISMMNTGDYLFLGKSASTTACSQTAGSAAGCELMVFDISSSTNPTYVAGRDSDGSSNGSIGVSFLTLASVDNYLYIGKNSNATACSQTAGSARGCELMVFDISSSTNPTYVAGRDASGDSSGTGSSAMTDSYIFNGYIYLSKTANGGTCSLTAGSAAGCELMVFNISSSTNPVYASGVDSSGSIGSGSGSLSANSLYINGNNLYLGKNPDATACSQTAGSAIGCELMVFDISSTTNPVYVIGKDESGSANGTSASSSVDSIYMYNNYLYLGKLNDATACSQTAGSAKGCELMVFSPASGFVYGNLTGANALAGISAQDGLVTMLSNASTTNVTVVSGATLIAPPSLTVSGNLSNNGTYTHSSGTVTLSGSNQSLVSTATTTFYALNKSVSSADTLTFTAGGTYIFANNLNLSGTSSNLLSLRSSNQGNVWYINPQASTTVSYLNVKDSFNINVATITCSLGCVSAGNNTKWDIASVLPILSGIIYSGVGTSEYTSGGKTIKVVVNGASTYTDTLDGGSGSWSVDADVATGSIVTIYVDGDATFRASLVTRMASISNVSNLHLYKDHLIVRSEDGTSVPVTNTTLGTYDSSDDTDIQFAVTNNDLAQIAGQSLYIYSNTNYLPNGEVTVGKSLTATSSAVTNFSTTTFNFIATSTATVTATTTFGDMNFNSTSGDWYFANNATATNFTIMDGTVTAPSTLTVTRNFTNQDIYNSNSGTLYINNTRDEVISYLSGMDTKGSNDGTGAADITTLVVKGNYLYVGKSAIGTACSQTAGSAGVNGCELMVFDISSSTNPVYVAGRDASGDDSGTDTVKIIHLATNGNYLYVAKNSNATACSQTASSAEGCELMVFDISSSTNPVYVAGRDASGNSSGIGSEAINQIAISGNYLYVVKDGNATACSQTAGSADGCEIMAFDISSSTNPVYVAGRDVKGDGSGTGGTVVETLTISGNYLFVGKGNHATACSQTAGSAGAQGCELMVFDISSSTNPVYVAGRDASGGSDGTGSLYINSLKVKGSYLFVGKDGDATACSQTAGSAIGCELMVFDISSTTNPTYVAGRDVDGTGAGTASVIVTSVMTYGNELYVGKDITACSETAGSAIGTCELMVFDISSTTNPVFKAGINGTGNDGASTTVRVNYLANSNGYIYVGKDGDTTACSQTAGSAQGCELMVFSPAAGIVSGNLNGTNPLASLSIQDGKARILNTATTSALTIASGAVLDVVDNLSMTGNYTNNGTVSYDTTKNLYFVSNSAQGLSGSMTNTSALPNVIFSGSGTKTINNNASTSKLTINSGSTVVAPSILTITGDYTNNGTFSDNGGLSEIKSYITDYLSGRDASGSATNTVNLTISSMVVDGNYLYASKSNSATACSQTAGSADGCELMVFDISSSTNPVYVAGRDASGNSSGTGSVYILAMAISGNNLYVGKNTSATACSQTAGSADGCELMVFDISSSTNPVYVAGRDASGNSSGTGNKAIYSLIIKDNYLYAGKDGDATACSQTAGSAIGCELMVFDISSSTNPTYVAGRDASGDSSGTRSILMFSTSLNGNYLYIGKSSDATACSQTAGSAVGCELMVFDISSSTNPIYKAGRDASGDSAGTASLTFNSLIIKDNYLYVGKNSDATACSQTAGSAIGCELMVFDISSSTNPIYKAGRDASGDSAGIGNVNIRSLNSSGNYLYAGKFGDATACSQTAGSAIGCELMVFDISSSTNPTYVAGRDASGDSTGTASVLIISLNSDGNYLYASKSNSATACSQTVGSAQGCEMMVFDISSNLSGAMTGTSDFNNLTIMGGAIMSSNASTSNLTIATSSTLTAPSALTVSGNLSNYGTYNANSGLVTLSGTNQSLISPATTTFYSLTKSVETADTLTFTNGGTYKFTGTLTLGGASSNRLSLRSSSTTGEWYIDPQATTTVSYLDVKDSKNINVSTISCLTDCLDSGNNTNWSFSDAASLVSSGNYHFYVGQATTTLDQITITKLSSGTDITTTNDLRINIATTTTNFRFDTGTTNLTFGGTASGKVSGTVSYENSGATLVVNVTSNFSQNDTLTINGIKVGSFSTVSTTSSRLALYTSGSISGSPTTQDSKTINVTGSITSSDHTLGQVTNQFSFQNKADEAMFAFNLVPSSENATVTDMVITLSGIQGVDTGEFSDFKLYKDNNSDRVIDGGDTLIDGSGIMTMNGQHGAITFSSDFLVNSAKDYIVTADTNVIDKDDALVIKLLTTGITAVGTSSAFASVIIGTPNNIQHQRHVATGGGSSSRIGDDAPAGNGIVGGGGSGSGDGAGQENDGENIASNPNFMRPTATGDVFNEWTNPSNALLSDGVYATAGSNGLRQSYNGFNFGIAGGNTIQGIAVKLDASGSTANGTIDVSISWDGGSSYTTAKATPTLSGTDIVYTVGNSSDTWGRSWSVSEFNPANFRIRVTAAPSSNTLRLDALEIRVYHQTGGGGGGGGGGI